MIVAMLCVYLVLLFALVRLHIVSFNLFWKTSPFIVLLLLNLGLFIPMGWGAPQGPVLVVRNSVAIVPSVAGEVIDVPVEANKPLKAGDVLFRIDPVPYEAQVAAIEAQLKLSDLRLSQMTQLYERFGGKVESVLQAVASGQVQTSGLAVTPKEIASAPFVVRIRLDDAAISRRLPAGSTGDAAVFTDHVKLAHIIRKVLLRQIAITNYVNPF
jgi:hypothetical protein